MDDESWAVRRSPGLGAVIATSLLTSAIVSMLTVFAVTKGGWLQKFGAPDTVDVPRVVGLSAESAQEILAGRTLRLVMTGEEPNAEIPAGQISGQTPLAGSQLPKGASVEVKVSSGAPKAAVPDVRGKSAEQAKADLTRAGFEVGAVSVGAGGAPGTVTQVDPSPGSSVPLKSKVALSVSPSELDVPALKNMPLADAKSALEQLGLKVGKVRYRDADGRAGTVLSHTPDAGQKVPPGATIDIVVVEE